MVSKNIVLTAAHCVCFKFASVGAGKCLDTVSRVGGLIPPIIEDEDFTAKDLLEFVEDRKAHDARYAIDNKKIRCKELNELTNQWISCNISIRILESLNLRSG